MLFHRIFRSAAAALLACAAASAFAQGYPNKAVRVIIPFPPGGPTDTVGRMLAQKLSEQTGQSFIVDNRPGGQGIIGADAVAKGTADGYTLLFSASSFTTTPMTLKSSPYDVTKDFEPSQRQTYPSSRRRVDPLSAARGASSEWASWP